MAESEREKCHHSPNDTMMEYLAKSWLVAIGNEKQKKIRKKTKPGVKEWGIYMDDEWLISSSFIVLNSTECNQQKKVMCQMQEEVNEADWDEADGEKRSWFQTRQRMSKGTISYL